MADTQKHQKHIKSPHVKPASSPGIKKTRNPSQTEHQKTIQDEYDDWLSPPNWKQIEAMSHTIWEAAMRGHSFLTETVEKAMEKEKKSGSFFPNRSPFHLSHDFTKAWEDLCAHPDDILQAQADLMMDYANLWRFAARRLAGDEAEAVIEPDQTDRRFRDQDWQDNPVFDVIKQAYLLTAKFLETLVSKTENLDPKVKQRVVFFTKQFVDSLSPSNFALTNPGVLRETLKRRGENLTQGLIHLMEDLDRGGGRLSPRQTDLKGFKVGEDLATTPGKIVFRNDILELLYYTPTTKTVYKTPLLIVPPWINKFYILDMREKNSMVRWLVDQGYSVFLISWINPGPEHAETSFEAYLQRGLLQATRNICEATGEKEINVVGYCIGGTLLATALAFLAQGEEKLFKNATFFATQTDFKEAGDLSIFTDDLWMEEIKSLTEGQGGVLDGRVMADTFNILRSRDLIWSFVIQNYLMGREPRAFDLLYWNADQTRLPQKLHLFYLEKFYRKNALAEGDLRLGGRGLDLKKVKIPIYTVATKEDHIAPAVSVWRGGQLFGGSVRFVLSGSGHIAGIVNPPEAQKYCHWIYGGRRRAKTLEAFLDLAELHPGSWWTDWAKWLSRKSGRKIPARQSDELAAPLKVLGEAPGSYVMIR